MSKFSEQIEHLLQYNGIDADTFLEAALSLHSNQKNTGIQKYALELRLMDDLTTQINQAFRNLIIKTITQNEKAVPSLHTYDTRSSNDFIKDLEHKYNDLNHSYQNLLDNISTNNKIVAQLTVMVKENKALLEQHAIALAKLEDYAQTKPTGRGPYKKNKATPTEIASDPIQHEISSSDSSSEPGVVDDDDSVP
ncbi:MULTISPECIES: hypothetical protein [Paenibacillus]|uniref:hypothetical protein n=1 Tax=Paenibacillus TaxID=44249 RepID=UPI00096F7246|nr:hypothetical protein [Paenibacillus odorifer]OME52817.1 hypothetical protein BSK61_18105 [Paenibacillus odorifer]